jgi:hypothetical protein
VPDPSPLRVEIAIAKLESSDQIQSELVQALGETSLSEIRKRIDPLRNKEELPDWNEYVIVLI